MLLLRSAACKALTMSAVVGVGCRIARSNRIGVAVQLIGEPPLPQQSLTVGDSSRHEIRELLRKESVLPQKRVE